VKNLVDFDYTQAIGLAFLICLGGNIGDIIESKIKRLLGKKDSSQLLPGHGGFFDRIDSIIISLPISYLFLQLFY
jgi:phosphatidate cytidylyltransferase